MNNQTIMDDRSHLLTERSNPRSQGLDRMTVAESFALINSEDATVAVAVSAERDSVCAAIELVIAAFRSGGRLIYVGAGTSGRLATLDAVECPPTFLSEPSMVQAVIAGGSAALTRSVEGAEDDAASGAEAMDSRNVGPADVVMGIASGGTTPFVHGAIGQARRRGARTIFFACVSRDQAADDADVSIRVLTGPEVLTGSTRMKAGAATKMVLNIISTVSMAQIGKVHGNLMVDVNTRSNTKLVDRGIRILQSLTGASRMESAQLLHRAGGSVKTAVVMQRLQVDLESARRILDQEGGRLSNAIEHRVG